MTLSVSVVIPTYNRARLVQRAVNNVLSECRADDEIIVVDDGSTDDTAEILRGFGDHIRVIQTPNGGAGRARNIGVLAARQPLVAFLDSDDEWIPGRLDPRRRLMEARPDVLFCFSDFTERLSDGTLVHNGLKHWDWGQDRTEWQRFVAAGERLGVLAPGVHDDCASALVHAGDLFHLEMSANYVFANTLLVRRCEAGEALRFPEDLPTYEDWECFARLSRAGTGAFIECETAYHDAHSGARLTDASALVTASTRLIMLERVWGRDEQYLAEHGEAYRQVLRRVRLERIDALLVNGQTAAARRELALTTGASWRRRTASKLPGGALTAMLRARATIRRFGRGAVPRRTAPVMTRREWLGVAAAGVLVVAGAARSKRWRSLIPAGTRSLATTPITIYESPTCECCDSWVRHLGANGFTASVTKLADASDVKRRHHVPVSLWTCHTAVVGDYAIEGHVPADLIRTLLQSHAPIAGLAAPGMPSGAPGMERTTRERYQVIAFTRSGATYVEATRG